MAANGKIKAGQKVKEVIKKVGKKVKDEFQEHAPEVIEWVKEDLGPELLQFLMENKDVAIKVIRKVAKEMASADGAHKREVAFSRLDDYFADEYKGGGIKVSSTWIYLLIEIVIAILKNAGKMK